MNNAEFNDKVDELWKKTKDGELFRKERFEAIEALTDAYILANDKKPEAGALDRLSTLCLYEEVTDKHPDKMAREDAPIMSDTQYRRKTEGKHVRRTNNAGEIVAHTTEVPLKAAYNIGTDGRDYGQENKRRLSTDEALIVDRSESFEESSRNKYRQAIKNSEVRVSYVD